MGEALLKKQFYTVEEYFELEENSEIRHEFFDGEIFAMAGTTLNHSRIVSNVEFSLRNQRKKYCDVFRESVKLEVVKNSYYPYPDVMLTCNAFDLRQKNKIINPSLIIEILSASTEKYDRNFKLKKYKSIASVQYYVLISQYEMSVELYSRVDSFQWIYTEYSEPNQVVELKELDITISLSDIYENIEFQAEESEEELTLSES